MRFQPSIREAFLRMFKIPLVGMAPVFAFVLVTSDDTLIALCFSAITGVLLYIPLFGLLYFETRNWLDLKEDGISIHTDGDSTFFAWQDIDYLTISRDVLIILGKNPPNKKSIHYLSYVDKKHIYKTYFEAVGLKPNQSSFVDLLPGRLTWDRKR